jgi:hypothetical protein
MSNFKVLKLLPKITHPIISSYLAGIKKVEVLQIGLLIKTYADLLTSLLAG